MNGYKIKQTVQNRPSERNEWRRLNKQPKMNNKWTKTDQKLTKMDRNEPKQTQNIKKILNRNGPKQGGMDQIRLEQTKND